MKSRKVKIFNKLIDLAYIFGCLALYLFSVIIIGYSIYQIFSTIGNPDFKKSEILDDVGVIVFGIAVIDVAKYLLQEEIFKAEDNRGFKEMRKTITKVVSIVSTALFLKGLIMTMEASKKDWEMIRYPLMVVISPVFLLIGLGIYHFFSKKNEFD